MIINITVHRIKISKTKVHVVSPIKMLERSIFFSLIKICIKNTFKILIKMESKKVYFLGSYWLKIEEICDFI